MSDMATVAAIRYGYGFAPDETGPEDMTGLMGQFSHPRDLLKGVGLSTQASLEILFKFHKTRIASRGNPNRKALLKPIQREIMRAGAMALRQRVADALAPNAGFKERLVGFWADHFAVSARKNKASVLLSGAFVEEAIRMNVASNFPKMLKAVVQHPAMLEYLDQNASIGPTSSAGRAKGKGLNENLARELLELHTLGVNGAYSQKDVRQLAELLTGLTYQKNGFQYYLRRAEPGSEQVLGRTYGEDGEGLDNILKLLDDLARHPDTARHIAGKLVAHFVSDTPNLTHVKQVADVFFKTEGDFMATYAALLDHPEAWVSLGAKVKRPFDFVISGLRSFGVTGEDIMSMRFKELRQTVAVPLALMGQKFMQPLGPDGWPEDAEYWITPQGLAGRIQWANLAVMRYGAWVDPRDYVRRTLHDFATQEVILAATRAEVRREGLVLVLASPEFNRR